MICYWLPRSVGSKPLRPSGLSLRAKTGGAPSRAEQFFSDFVNIFAPSVASFVMRKFSGAFLILLLAACSSGQFLTHASLASQHQSLNAYTTDRENGWPFRAGFYDSAYAWAASDTMLTKFYVQQLAIERPKDSVNSHHASFFANERSILGGALNQMDAVAK